MLSRMPDRWSEGTGTALVLDRNKNNLSVSWIRTLCELCKSHIMPLAHTFGESEGDVDRLHELNADEWESSCSRGGVLSLRY